MKTIFMILAATFTMFAATAQKANTSASKSSVVYTVYSCSMHPEFVRDKPGKCPKCGMDLTLTNKKQTKADVTYTCPMHPEVVSHSPGVCAKCSSKLVVDRTGSKQAKTVYTCAMHPDVASEKPGKCPVCGMELTAKVETKSKKG